MKNLLLSNQEYKDILTYYDINHTNMTDIELRQRAEGIIASKLCKCIKKVTKNSNFKTEQPAIAICNNSILKSRNLKYYGFNCIKTSKLLPFGSKGKNLNKYTKQGNNIGLIKQTPNGINISKQKKPTISKNKTIRKKGIVSKTNKRNEKKNINKTRKIRRKMKK